MADDARELARTDDRDVIVDAVERFIATPMLTRSQARKLFVAGACIAALGGIALVRASSAEQDRFELEEDNLREHHARAQDALVAAGHNRVPWGIVHREMTVLPFRGHRGCSCGYVEPLDDA